MAIVLFLLFFLACIFCPHPQSNMSVNIRNLMVITYYSGTCAIRHLSFPTSCDIRQFYGPKVFMLTKIKPEYSDILYHPTHSLVPWYVGLDRFHCICLNELKFYLLPEFWAENYWNISHLFRSLMNKWFCPDQITWY
jgi:hypothetical protein